MTKTSLNKCIKTVKDELNNIYNSGETDFELLSKIQYLIDDISHSDDFKNLTYIEIEKLTDVLQEVLEEKFIFTRKV